MQEQWVLDDFKFFDKWTELENDIPDLKHDVHGRIERLRPKATDGYND